MLLHISISGFVRYILVFWLLALSVAEAAPTPGRVYHLLMLDSQGGSPYGDVYAAMMRSLEALGYREGENLSVTRYTAGNDIAHGKAILRRAWDEKHDVVYTGGTVATIAAKQVFFGTDQPVVFASPTDPVGIGVIDGFDQPPKANFTGVCYPVPVKARLRFIRSLFPKASRFGLIYADMPQSHSYNDWVMAHLEEDPALEGMEILFRSVPLVKGESGDEKMAQLARTIVEELNERVDVFISANDQLGARQHFSDLIRTHTDKPLIGIVRNDVMDDWGAMATVYPSHESIGRQAARMVRDLLEGVSIERIQPEWPARYGYAVDLQKARKFGVSVPIGILQLAGENIVR
ncbi:MAG: hypothetical protein KZQ93_17900 [Candidatus Thiodiazotropha sp. (ex Monitilora ramsayi)]|nr:hypothetical protein [Candidatus Thiodiazotropha sp. (ex Monitilora ramsayi)]